MKKLLTLISTLAISASAFALDLTTPVEASALTEAESLNEKSFHNYVGLGTSTYVVIPYAGNISLGTRYAQPGYLIGLDASLRIDGSVAFESGLLQLAMPLYFSPNKIHSSWYIGPSLGLGIYHVRMDGWPSFVPRIDPKILVGKQFMRNDRISFMQVVAAPFTPTLFEFQYGIGF
ncbi:MAG: hypothetical protein S4CHLAM102_02300 [Chlamydiia bacterium]|nr:hypothetical protein [Chlamydiia bacterium]